MSWSFVFGLLLSLPVLSYGNVLGTFSKSEFDIVTIALPEGGDVTVRQVVLGGGVESAVSFRLTVLNGIESVRKLLVLPPPGGCSTRSTVLESSRFYGCSISVNGGFWNTSSDVCIGNLVSQGRVIQYSQANEPEPRPMFSLLPVQGQGGKVKLGFGYLEDTIIQSSKEVISGSGWIVRKRMPYLKESQNRQASLNGEMSSKRAQRNAIGLLSSGNIALVQTTYHEGLTLQKFAEYLVQMDFEQVINLDGGGSVTQVINEVVLDHGGDPCAKAEPTIETLAHGKNLLCQRKVSSILCLRDVVANFGPDSSFAKNP